jgi:hypothetical protein
MEDFTEHYTIINPGQELLNTLAQAKALAKNSLYRIWFVREGDDEVYWATECKEDPPGEDAEDGDYDDWVSEMIEKHGSAPWAVELLNGQFVNCLGYFVTKETCKPEHQDEIFSY